MKDPRLGRAFVGAKAYHNTTQSLTQAHPDRIDWRAVIVNALALAYVLFCGLVVLWWLT